MTKNQRALWLMMGFVLLSGCAPSLAGVIKDTEGKLVSSPSATVNVSSLNGDASVILTVDRDGRFQTDEALPDGDYLIEALVPGYSLESQRVSVGTTKEVELTLRALDQTKPAAIGANMDGEIGRGAGGATLTPPQL